MGQSFSSGSDIQTHKFPIILERNGVKGFEWLKLYRAYEDDNPHYVVNKIKKCRWVVNPDIYIGEFITKNIECDYHGGAHEYPDKWANHEIAKYTKEGWVQVSPRVDFSDYLQEFEQMHNTELRKLRKKKINHLLTLHHGTFIRTDPEYLEKFNTYSESDAADSNAINDDTDQINFLKYLLEHQKTQELKNRHQALCIQYARSLVSPDIPDPQEQKQKI